MTIKTDVVTYDILLLLSLEIKVFKFGGCEILTPIASAELPRILAHQKVTIKTDAFTHDIPLLLFPETMKKAGVKLKVDSLVEWPNNF